MNVAQEIRELRKMYAALARRLSTLLLVGTAEANQGAKTKVRFDDVGADGKPFSSPYLAQANSAGQAGQGVSRFTKIGAGEPVLVISPGGELGEHSRVMPFGHVGERPSPGAAEQDGEVTTIGDATLAIKNGEAKLSVGGASITIAGGTITLRASTIRMEQG